MMDLKPGPHCGGRLAPISVKQESGLLFPFLLRKKAPAKTITHIPQFRSHVIAQWRVAETTTRLSPGPGDVSNFSSVANVGSGNRHLPAEN